MGDALAEVLDPEECLRLMALVAVGRMAVVHDGGPVIFPVNHRLVRADDSAWILVRTGAGSTLDLAQGPAAFEVDGIDDYHRRGWSVLARGELHHLAAATATAGAARVQPEPWLVGPLDHWLALEVDEISGRRLVDAEPAWVFHLHGYL